MGVDENFENFSANYFIYFQEYVQRSNYTIVECMNEIEIKGGEKEIFSNMRTILLIQSLEAGGNFENFSTNYFIIYRNIINYFPKYVQRSNYMIVECINEIEIKRIALRMSSGMISKMLKRKERGGKFFSDTRAP